MFSARSVFLSIFAASKFLRRLVINVRWSYGREALVAQVSVDDLCLEEVVRVVETPAKDAKHLNK